MKIEMGESLCYSWLRHIKGCQIVQTNWKLSPAWSCSNTLNISKVLDSSRKFFQSNYDCNLFGKSTLPQILNQGECDVLGIDFQNTPQKIYAIDIAFHTGGLGYGSSATNVQKIVEKCLRTAMCLYGYFGNSDAEVIFATPKISSKTLHIANNWLGALQKHLNALNFKFQIIANQNFCNLLLFPVMSISSRVNDTSELFLRSYQLLNSCCNCNPNAPVNNKGVKNHLQKNQTTYQSFKVGQLANIVLRSKLESIKLSQDELADLQDRSTCNLLFGINYPLLVTLSYQFELDRYYVQPLSIDNKDYYLCSQWYEKNLGLLIDWIERH